MILNNPIMAKISIMILTMRQVMHEPGDSKASGYAIASSTRSRNRKRKADLSILISGLCLSCSLSVGILLIMKGCRKVEYKGGAF